MTEESTDHRVVAVWDEVLTPMTSLYQPPFGKTQEQATDSLSQYVDELKGFNRDELRRGYLELRGRWKQKTWPPIPELIDACKAAKYGRAGPKSDEKTVKPINWERQRELYTEYVDAFMRDALGAEATAGGWGHDLRDYVHKCAHYQAQIVAKSESNGHDRLKIHMGDGRRESFSLDALEREQQICVEVPTALMEQWRAAAAHEKLHGSWGHRQDARSKSRNSRPRAVKRLGDALPPLPPAPRPETPRPEEPPDYAFEERFDPV